MQNQTTIPTPASPTSVPASQSLHPGLAPRPQQATNPQAERQQEQARQQVQQ